MNPKLVALLASLVGLLVLGGVGYLWLAESGPPGDRGLTAEAKPGGKGGLHEVGGARSEPGGSPRGAGAKLTLRGRVVRPAACAVDDALEVFALERPAPLDGALRALAAAEKAPESSPVLARAKVDEDGSFSLALPETLERVNLVAVGRFLYTYGSGSAELGDEAPPVQLRPQCGAALQGRVWLPDGEEHGAGGIELRLAVIQRGTIGRERTLRSAVTDPDGSFEFRAIPTPGRYELQIHPAHHAALSHDVGDLEAGQVTELELSLSAGGTVSGRVVDEAGAGVAGAVVGAVVSAPRGRIDWGEREVQTAEDGSFRLEHVPATTVAIRADHEALLQSPVTHVRVREGREASGVRITLLPGGTIAGVLRWPDSRPVAGEAVRVEFDPANRFGGIARNLGANRGARGSARTDAEGRFEVTGLGTGPFSVLARVSTETAEGESAAGFWAARVDDVPPGERELQLVLAAVQPLRGRVIDTEGVPVREFRIHAAQLMQTGLGPLARDQRDQDFVDLEGHFELCGLEPGAWNLYAIADGFGASPPIRIELPPGSDGDLEFRLARAARVVGRVLAPDGSPLSGAVIRTDEGGPEWMSNASGNPRRPATTSREDGRFELSGLAPGPIRLYARAEGFTRGPATLVEVGVGGEADGVELTVRAGGEVTGEVFGPGGLPIAEAVVQLVSTSDYEIVFTQSDGAGEFRSENLDPGTWQVIVLPPQNRMEELATGGGERRNAMLGEIKVELIEVVDGESAHVIFGAPLEDPVRVVGRLERAGKPVRDAIVGLVREGEGVMQRLRRTSSDPEGRFAATVDGGGTYVVTVTRRLGGVGREATLEFPIEVSETDEHALVLKLPDARISGHVRGPDGRPAARARVTLMPHGALSSAHFEGHRTSEDLTGPDGRYDLDGLPPGDYLLAVGGMDTAGLFGRSLTDVAHGRALRRVRLRDDEWLENVDVELGPAARVVVRVRDERGRPVPGTTVFVRDSRGDPLENIALAKTEDDGSCEYDGLAAGVYTFCARDKDLASEWSAPVEVAEGGSGEVELRLRESTFLWVRLVDGQGRGVRGELRVVDELGHEVQRLISLDELTGLLREHGFSTSERRFGPLPPGRYRIEATRGGETIEKRITLTGRKERKQTLRFKE